VILVIGANEGREAGSLRNEGTVRECCLIISYPAQLRWGKR